MVMASADDLRIRFAEALAVMVSFCINSDIVIRFRKMAVDP